MFVDECHVTSMNQGLLSTTMEAEKRNPGNVVEETQHLKTPEIKQLATSARNWFANTG